MGVGTITMYVIKKETKSYRNAAHFRFGEKMALARASRHASPVEYLDPILPTRSLSAAIINNWLINMDAAKCEVTNVRRLNHYPLEHIITLPVKSNLLHLVAVEDNDNVCNGDTQLVDCSQNIGHITVSGYEY